MTEQELKKKAIASMDNCYLEIGTIYPDVVQTQAIPPALREKIYDQILAIIKEAGYVKLADNQSLPNPLWKHLGKNGKEFIQENQFYLAGQKGMLKAGWRKVEVKDEQLSSK